ncbi:hypothetical protein NDN08_004828 [Rhodosorus marinus]|uniref:Uncharacterized protein n=1 Tax=Rhodosorus marinus TaxID=101924 RepID=A0AAV8URL7_9RHOD|nr:hypothetical protein NDN08_004828 [Rhodosorus marinus]
MAELIAAFQSMILALRDRLADVVGVVFPAFQMPEDFVRELDEAARDYHRDNSEAQLRALLKAVENGNGRLGNLLEALSDLRESISHVLAVKVFTVLSHPRVMLEMVQLLMKKEETRPEETDLRLRYAHTYVAATILKSGSPELRELAVNHSGVMCVLLGHFKKPMPLDPLITEKVSLLISSFSSDFPFDLLEHVEGKGFIRSAAVHISNPSVAEMIGQLFVGSGGVEQTSLPVNGFMQFFFEEKVYDVLVDRFLAASECESLLNRDNRPDGLCLQEQENSLSAMHSIIKRVAPLFNEGDFYSSGDIRDAFDYMQFVQNEQHLNRIFDTAIELGERFADSSALTAAMRFGSDLLEVFSSGTSGTAANSINKDDSLFANSVRDSWHPQDDDTTDGDGGGFGTLKSEMGRPEPSGSQTQKKSSYEAVLIPRFAGLSRILERHIAATRQSISNKNPYRLGSTVLEVVTFLGVCFQARNRDVRNELFRLGIHAQLYDMLALHEDSSMLHQTVEVTVEFGLLNDPKLGRIVWLKEFRLAEKLLSFWESSCVNITGRWSTRLSTAVQMLYYVLEIEHRNGGDSSEVKGLLGEETYDRFVQYYENELSEILRIENQVIGGSIPRQGHNGFHSLSDFRHAHIDEFVDSDDEEDTFSKRRSSSRIRNRAPNVEL